METAGADAGENLKTTEDDLSANQKQLNAVCARPGLDEADAWSCDDMNGRPQKPVVVWKLGGSVLKLQRSDCNSDSGGRFERPVWPERFRQALKLLEPHRPLLVVGGGDAADLVRVWDRCYLLGDEPAHWLALAALGLNERLVECVLTEAVRVVSRLEAQAAWEAGRIPVLAAERFVADEERDGAGSLPHCWDVTSDSVAAWVAVRWPAQQLVLLKSTDLEGRSCRQAAEEELVDPYFVTVSRELKSVKWVNLRAERLQLERLI